MLTDGAERRFLDDGQRAVVYGQVADVHAQEHETLQLGQVVVPELQVEYDQRRFALEHGHRLGDVLQVRELAQDVEATVLFYRAHARRDLTVRGTLLDHRAAGRPDDVHERGRRQQAAHQQQRGLDHRYQPMADAIRYLWADDRSCQRFFFKKKRREKKRETPVSIDISVPTCSRGKRGWGAKKDTFRT